MDDLISRQAAIDVIDAILPVEPMKNEYTQGITCGAALAIEYVKQLPSAEPEITRCKDCKHRDKYGCCKYWKGLVMVDVPIATDDNDFCSYAERI